LNHVFWISSPRKMILNCPDALTWKLKSTLLKSYCSC
jgi:hypothetical protein